MALGVGGLVRGSCSFWFRWPWANALRAASVSEMLTRAWWWWCAGWSLGLAAACGGGRATPTPHPTPPPDAAPAAMTDAGAPSLPATPSGDECDALLDHMLDLYVAQQRLDRPPEWVPTADGQAKVRASMVKDGFLKQCLDFPREAYACTMAAARFADAVRCAGGDPATIGQPRRSP